MNNISMLGGSTTTSPSKLTRRRGTARGYQGSSRLFLVLFMAMTILAALIVGILIGILFFGGSGAVAGNQPQSPTGLLRGVHLRERIHENTERFRNYLQDQEQRQGKTRYDSNGKLLAEEYPYMGSPPPFNYDIASMWLPPGGKRYAEYTDGSSPYRVSEAQKEESDDLARIRRDYVKRAMQFAWDGYTKYAFGMDEILPNSRRGTNSWGGFAVTLVDSLDTLWLMDMKEEFWQARDYVRDSLKHDKDRAVSTFETTIRSLGGLLSAYDWSGDKVFLDSALDLGTRLIKAFDNSPTGIPFGQVNLATGQGSNIQWAGNNAILAEFGTMQLEFRWLDIFVNTPETATMRRKVEHVFEILHSM